MKIVAESGVMKLQAKDSTVGGKHQKLGRGKEIFFPRIFRESLAMPIP